MKINKDEKKMREYKYFLEEEKKEDTVNSNKSEEMRKWAKTYLHGSGLV